LPQRFFIPNYLRQPVGLYVVLFETMLLMKRLLLLITVLVAVVASGCASRRGVTRYNTSKQMYKHSTMNKIPRAKASREQRYHRIGRRDRIMNKSK
jgi:hypothetical protein